MVETLTPAEAAALKQIRMDRFWSVNQLARDIRQRCGFPVSTETVRRIDREPDRNLHDKLAHQLRRYLALVAADDAQRKTAKPRGAHSREATR